MGGGLRLEDTYGKNEREGERGKEASEIEERNT